MIFDVPTLWSPTSDGYSYQHHKEKLCRQGNHIIKKKGATLAPKKREKNQWGSRWLQDCPETDA